MRHIHDLGYHKIYLSNKFYFELNLNLNGVVFFMETILFHPPYSILIINYLSYNGVYPGSKQGTGGRGGHVRCNRRSMTRYIKMGLQPCTVFIRCMCVCIFHNFENKIQKFKIVVFVKI